MMHMFHWYTWVLISLGYLVAGTVTGGIWAAWKGYRRIELEEACHTGLFAIFWPVTLPTSLIIICFFVFGGAAACLGTVVKERVQLAFRSQK